MMITLTTPTQQRAAVQLLRAAHHALAMTSELADALEFACRRTVDRAACRIIIMVVCALWSELYGGAPAGHAAELVCNLVSVLW